MLGASSPDIGEIKEPSVHGESELDELIRLRNKANEIEQREIQRVVSITEDLKGWIKGLDLAVLTETTRREIRIPRSQRVDAGEVVERKGYLTSEHGDGELIIESLETLDGRDAELASVSFKYPKERKIFRVHLGNKFGTHVFDWTYTYPIEGGSSGGRQSLTVDLGEDAHEDLEGNMKGTKKLGTKYEVLFKGGKTVDKTKEGPLPSDNIVTAMSKELEQAKSATISSQPVQ